MSRFSSVLSFILISVMFITLYITTPVTANHSRTDPKPPSSLTPSILPPQPQPATILPAQENNNEDESEITSNNNNAQPTTSQPKPTIVQKSESTETECIRKGECQQCATEELSEPYCDTGEKDLLLCKVYSLTNRTLIEREYSQFISCADVDGTEGAKSFWIFEGACLSILLPTLWFLHKRQIELNAQHNRRLDRMINS